MPVLPVLHPPFLCFFAQVVHYPPVGRTEQLGNIGFLPETFFLVLFCRQVPPSSPSATAVSYDPFLLFFTWTSQFAFDVNHCPSLPYLRCPDPPARWLLCGLLIGLPSLLSKVCLPRHEGSFAYFIVLLSSVSSHGYCRLAETGTMSRCLAHSFY